MLNLLQGHAAMERRTQKQASVGIASVLLQVFWPDFIEEHGCVFAAFHLGPDSVENGACKTELECFINHTHIMDEFLNEATFQHREQVSKETRLKKSMMSRTLISSPRANSVKRWRECGQQN